MNYNISNKITVCPQIVIYKNVLEDADKIFNFVKNSESNTYSGSYFNSWQEWNSTDNTTGKVLKINYDSKKNNDINIQEKEIINYLQEIRESIRDDYFNEWSAVGEWPAYITNWNWKSTEDGFNSWHYGSLDFLKYSVTKGENHDPKNGIYNLPMNYHVDQFPAENEWESAKFIITITIYLNNDYEGGEISFYDDKNKKVYAYKPNPGDITVFPSNIPFFHGVLPMSGNERYLIRTFVCYMHEGSESWKNEFKKYSEEEWKIKSKKILQDGYDNSIHNLRILYEGDITEYNKKMNTVILKDNPIIIQ